MSFREIPPKKVYVDLNNQGKLDLYDKPSPGYAYPRQKYWYIRIGLLIISAIVLAVPLLLFSLVQYLRKERKSANGKVILITGAARGLGRQMSRQFAEMGAKVACVDMDGAGAAKTVEMIRAAGGVAYSFTTNIAKSDQVAKLRRDVERDLGSVDILVNNAAILMAMRNEEWDESKIRTFYEVNILGHIWMIKEFLPIMRQRKTGHIVSLSSASALFAVPFFSLYGSSKAAVTSLTDNLRAEMEMKKEPIKFTTIHPLAVNTNIATEEFIDAGVPSMREEDAAKYAIDDILLEKENTTLPSAVWPFAALDKLLPKVFNTLALFILQPGICLPQGEYQKTFPFKQNLEKLMKSS